ncbi:hypothetical protein BaRGS_00007169 [Batillaria attramentaria]|uniref:SMP domain-containing protein n=1 Tax=Batillaria attramentaria TaxID=370345 RepID=A0ABD0LRR0_9CAEN
MYLVHKLSIFLFVSADEINTFRQVNEAVSQETKRKLKEILEEPASPIAIPQHFSATQNPRYPSAPEHSEGFLTPEEARLASQDQSNRGKFSGQEGIQMQVLGGRDPRQAPTEESTHLLDNGKR